MIRLVLGIFGVAAVLCALIVMPPISGWRIFQTNMAAADSAPDAVQVTRNVEPTFSETGELLDSGYAFATDDATVEATATGVLAGLQGLNIDSLTPLQALLVQALKAGQTDADIKTALIAAAAAGQITIPATLVTADGGIDTVALLAGIDTAARSADLTTPVTYGTDLAETPEPTVPAAIAISGPRFHVVESGDSLGSISTAYFGSAQFGDLIFQANRDILSDPNDLNVGQNLVIPEQ